MSPELFEEFEELVDELRDSVGYRNYDRDEHYGAVTMAAEEFAEDHGLNASDLENAWHKKHDII